MGLTGSLQVGRSGLLTSQAAIQVTGHNLSNVGTAGYHRQTVKLSPADTQRLGPNAFLGRGVQLDAITRQVDEALEGRLRSAIGDESYSLMRHELLTQVEALHNELSDADLSTKLGAFFNAWSQLANNPQDLSLRSLVLEEASTLAGFIQNLRTDLTDLRSQVDKQATDAATQVDDLLTRIEELNERIAISGGRESTGAAGLKDERDRLLGELSQFLDISTVTHENGVTDVFVGSLPLMLNGQSRGVELRQQTIDGELQISLVLADDGSPLDISGGRLGALVNFRQTEMTQAIDSLDTFTNELIFQVNKVHSQGQGTQGYSQLIGSNAVLDPSAALNSADDTGLEFTPQHGTFKIHVTQKSTGQRITTTINVDLDGINPAGDTTLTSLTGDIDAVANISASITADGKLRIAADSSDYEISFSEDSSGVLATLGVGTFFTGTDALDVEVNAALKSNPKLLAAAQGHLPGDNRNALAMAALRDTKVEGLGQFSLSEYWNRHIEEFAIRTAQAESQAKADGIVRENLEMKQQQLSGVNADEEAINLLQYQRAYQASARFISVVDELMGTLLNMV